MFVTDENAERPETDDEGIERDSGDSDDDRMGNRAFNFESILEVSKKHPIIIPLLAPDNLNFKKYVIYM